MPPSTGTSVTAISLVLGVASSRACDGRGRRPTRGLGRRARGTPSEIEIAGSAIGDRRTSRSSAASAENSIGDVSERALSESARGPRATAGPNPHLTPHVGRVVRVPSPTPLGPRRDHRARHDRDWPGGRRQAQHGDLLGEPTRLAGESPGRSPSPPRVPLTPMTSRRNLHQSSSMSRPPTCPPTPARGTPRSSPRDRMRRAGDPGHPPIMCSTLPAEPAKRARLLAAVRSPPYGISETVAHDGVRG